MILPNLLLQLGPLSVYSFGMILAAIFVLGVFLFWRAAMREGFASDPIFDLIFLSVLAALLGGRLLFIVSTGDPPLTNLPAFGGAILRVGGGIFWTPAFLFGLIAFYLYIRRRKEWSFFKLAELAAPILALGQGIGFLGAEATGYLSSVAFVGAGYLVLFLVLEFIRRKITIGGAIFSVYLSLSGLLTVASEYLRETKAFAFGIDLNYLLGVLLTIAGALGLLYLFARSRGIPSFISRVESQLRFKLKRKRKDVTSSLRSERLSSGNDVSLRSERPSRNDETPTGRISKED